jgi:glutamate racemase
MWVPLIENNEINSSGADFFIKKNLNALFAKSNNIDTIILGCTHYPLLLNTIKKYIPKNITLLSQGEIVASSLADYLIRHPEIENKISKNNLVDYYTTDSTDVFNRIAKQFLGGPIESKYLKL